MSQFVSEYSHTLSAGQLVQAPSSRRALGLAVLALAQFMVVLDSTIVNIALPDIGAALQMREARLAWIITAYVVAFGGLLPLGGRLADLLGRRRIFAIGVGVFTAASLAGGLAQTPSMLIATRSVQGIGAALLAPAALGLVTAMFPAAGERAKALSIWGAVAAGGSAAGVLLGGLLTGGLGWRSVFLINVPVGVAVLLMAAAMVPESRARIIGPLSPARFDLPGAVTVTGGLVALVVTLSESGGWGWTSIPALAGFTVAALLLGAFMMIETRAAHPLVPLRLLHMRTVRTGNIVMVLLGAAMFAVFYFLSLYEQIVLGYGAIATGVSQLPLAAALVVAASAAAPVMARFGSRVVLVVALVTFAGGLGWLGLAPVGGTFTADLLGPTVLIGVGLGAAFVPVTAVALDRVPGDQAGVASGLVNTSQQVGGAIGLAALAALSTAGASSASQEGAAHLAALTSGFSWAFAAAAGLAILGAAITMVWVRRTDAADPDTARRA